MDIRKLIPVMWDQYQIKEINDIPDALPAEDVGPSKEFLEWLPENEWYSENADMKKYADAYAERPELQALPVKKLFEVVTNKTKEMFPENFSAEQPKPKVPAVEGAGNGKVGKPARKSKFKYSDLSDDQKDVCKFNVKHGILTEEEYISQLEEIAKNRGLA